MSAETLLNSLHKVRKSGVDSWKACCPAHDDKTPSLSVKECSDGHILIHCFAGCSPEDILHSVGLKMADLMGDRNAHYFDDQPPPPPIDLNRRETEIANLEFRVQTLGRMIQMGRQLTDTDNKILRDSYEKLHRLRSTA